MSFPSAIWTFPCKAGANDGYLFVNSSEGILVPVTYTLLGGKYRYTGYGLWFHDISEGMIATTMIKNAGENRWMTEFYRIFGDWMQWSNDHADIFHDRVDEGDVPQEFLREHARIMKKASSLLRPSYIT